MTDPTPPPADRAMGLVSEVAQRNVEDAVMARLFGGSPKKPRMFGRYEVIDRLGQGAVGDVFLAKDPDLDREVAIKVLRANRGSEFRALLLAEARVMARLVHPNVVSVFDIGEDGDDVFVTMERIMGGTLRTWNDHEHPWQETVRVYRDAARGLFAAHREGVVHRDFKPDNILLSDQGEVKVTDFGLALIDDSVRERIAASLAPRPAGGHGDADDVPMLSRLSGTPAYMSPETIRGRPADAQSDQFGFFVALHEALHGRRPFAGDSVLSLFTNIMTGDRQPVPVHSRVPKRLQAVLDRGLQMDPARRFASMGKVVEALDQCLVPIWRRLAVPAAIGLGLSVGLGAWALSPPDMSAIERCTGGGERLAQVWNEARRAKISTTLLATTLPYAQEVHPLVDTTLRDYGDRWLSMFGEACEVHQRGEQSDTLYDLRMACLSEKLVALDSALAVLEETTESTLGRAANVADGLPALAACADAQSLAAERPPPPEQLASQVAKLRDRLIAVEALERAGRYVEALAEAEELSTAAQSLDYPPIAAQTELVRGRILLQTRAFDTAAAPLLDAALSSFEIGLDGVGLEALARHIHASAMTQDGVQQALYTIPFAEALTVRFAQLDFGRALVLNNAGTAYLVSGDRAHARELFGRALATKNEAGLTNVELSNILINVALLEPAAAERHALTSRAVSELETALGASHSMTLAARYVDSHAIEDPATAFTTRKPICESYARDHPEEADMVRECLYTLGLLAAELGRSDDAAALLERVVASATADAGPDGALVDVARAYGALERGQVSSARLLFEQTLASIGADQPWWVMRHAARAELGLARVWRSQGDRIAEHAAQRRAAAHLSAITKQSFDSDLHRLLSTTKRALAAQSSTRYDAK